MSASKSPDMVQTAKRKVLLVDDHPVVREGLIQRLNTEEDLVVCGEARTPAEALALIQNSQPDVIIVDLALPEGHGLELIKDIRSLGVRVPILVFSIFDEDAYALRALRAGAQGYLTKQETSERLIGALRAILKGEYALSPRIAKMFFDYSLQPAGVQAFPECLGDREMEVFELMGKGLGTRQVANHLGRSVKTIETYQARIKRKLNLKTATSLMREAVRWIETRR